jgi:hypothetical protein
VIDDRRFSEPVHHHGSREAARIAPTRSSAWNIEPSNRFTAAWYPPTSPPWPISPVGPEDWPYIVRLARADKLTYRDQEVRDLAVRLQPAEFGALQAGRWPTSRKVPVSRSVSTASRAYRGNKAMAIEAAEYLKQRHPHSEVTA